MINNCPNVSYWQADPRFPAFKEYYADRHFSDHHLLLALELFKSRHNDKYADDWLPTTPAEKPVCNDSSYQDFTSGQPVAEPKKDTEEKNPKKGLGGLFGGFFKK